MTVLSPECALLTAVFIFSGVANVLPSWQPCEERLQETAEEGEWVDVNATCYPNGTVSCNWSSDPRTERLQIEYQCYNATIHQDVPNPREPLLEWADIRSGSKTKIVQPWEDATSCIFSGCYESGPEMQYRTYWIQNFTCSINRVMTPASVLITSSSLGIHMASTSQPPLKLAPTVFPTAQPDSKGTTTTEWLIAVAVTFAVVVLITIGIVCLVIFIKHFIKHKQHSRPMILCDDKIDDSFSPVLEEPHKKISESIETIVCTLNCHHLEHKNTPRSYIRHSSPETEYTSNDTMNKSKNPNVLVPLDEHSESASVTNMNVYVGTQWTVEGEEGEVLEANGTVKEVSQAEEEEEEEEEEEKEEDKDEEEERSKVTCHDESNYDRVNSNTYESLEPKLPVDKFPTNDPKETTFSDVPLSSMSFYTYGGYLHSVQANTSRTSGYISDTNAMWNRSPILLSKADETGSGVRVQAACYPNGTVSYNWNSDPTIWHLLVEYQCYNNGSAHEQTPNPVRPRQLSWSDLDSGDGTFSIQPWEEGTSCVFSGCYDDSIERGYPTYWIPETTCTVIAIMTSSSALIMSSSPSLHMASSQPLLPSPTLLPTTIQPDPQNQDMSVVLFAVLVAPVLVVIVTAVCLAAVVTVRKRDKRRPRLKVGNDLLKGDFPPVSLTICEPMPASLETLLNVLETPCSHTHNLDYENTPKTYIRHAPPKVVEAENPLFLESADELSGLDSILVPPDVGSNITESANSRIGVRDHDSIRSQNSSSEVGNKTVNAIVTTELDSLEEAKQEDEEEEEGEKAEEMKEEGGRELVCSDLSEHVAYTQGTSGTYESLESQQHLFDLPEDEFPVSKPFTLGPQELTSISTSLAKSFTMDGGYLHPTSYLQTKSSGSSGYITDLSMMNTATPALMGVQHVKGEV